jgi:Arc/MetJ family transcription regulator
MRLNVEVDESIIAEAKRRAGLLSDAAVIEEALLTLIKLQKQREALRLRGKFTFVEEPEETPAS